MEDTVKIRVTNLSFSYRGRQILRDISARFDDRSITAIVGPSGVGKSTFLMTLNRLWENIPDTSMKGRVEIRFDGRFQDVYDPSFPVTRLRRLVALVFQSPNPLPMSIYRNVAFPLKLSGRTDKKFTEEKVEEVLRMAYLWDEVKDRLGHDARGLSGGQQQRLCIARALVLEPEVLLMDEPTSSLDPTATGVIEELLVSLKDRLSILVVSHYLDQVQRVADRIVTFTGGAIVTPDRNPFL